MDPRMDQPNKPLTKEKDGKRIHRIIGYNIGYNIHAVTDRSGESAHVPEPGRDCGK